MSNPFIQEQRKPYLAYLLIGVAGYCIGSYVHRNDGFKVSNGVISYDKIQRPVKIIDDRIVVGDVATRVDDLLLESPSDLEAALNNCLTKRGKILPK